MIPLSVHRVVVPARSLATATPSRYTVKVTSAGASRSGAIVSARPPEGSIDTDEITGLRGPNTSRKSARPPASVIVPAGSSRSTSVASTALSGRSIVAVIAPVTAAPSSHRATA